MKNVNAIALLAALVGFCGVPAHAAGVTEAELLQAATELGHQYDAHYAAKDAEGMASVYAADGELVSPAGPIVRGRAELVNYYRKRFASGARGHSIKVLEVHVLGDGGYGINQFSVTVPGADGSLHQERGTIVAVYRRDPGGWRMALVGPSTPPKAN
jgi:uncharacterized protein (TIGR02246 family)